MAASSERASAAECPGSAGGPSSPGGQRPAPGRSLRPPGEDTRAEITAAAEAFAAAAERALAGGESCGIAAGDLTRVMSAAVKLYAAKAEAGAPGQAPAPPVSAERVTPTEVVVVVSEMLRAVDVSLFDLAMWYRRGRG
jgi:hypothetical protein